MITDAVNRMTLRSSVMALETSCIGLARPTWLIGASTSVREGRPAQAVWGSSTAPTG